ncbi:MAG: hypothetical protein WCO48_03575 [Candidatus Taylorbacteria bacterium]
MNLFKDRKMPWWETGLIKWSVLCIGIAIGTYWSSVFAPYVLTLSMAGVVFGIIAAYFWFKE